MWTTSAWLRSFFKKPWWEKIRAVPVSQGKVIDRFDFLWECTNANSHGFQLHIWGPGQNFPQLCGFPTAAQDLQLKRALPLPLPLGKVTWCLIFSPQFPSLPQLPSEGQSPENLFGELLREGGLFSVSASELARGCRPYLTGRLSLLWLSFGTHLITSWFLLSKSLPSMIKVVHGIMSICRGQ
jgi:hypothetical protein